jgi:hypothetical protein
VQSRPLSDYADTRLRALVQADDDLRRESAALWHFANMMTWIIHPWLSLRLWWIDRSLPR